MADIPYESMYKCAATYRQRLDQAFSTLRGVIEGIAADQKVNGRESSFLYQWCDEHQRLVMEPIDSMGGNPWLKGLYPEIRQALADGVLTKEERSELLGHIDQVRAAAGMFFDDATHQIQELHGILGGIASDQTITVEELRGLQDWLGEHSHLQQCWPFTEADALVTSVLADGKISEEEHQRLVSYFGGFVAVGSPRILPKAVTKANYLDFVSACCPQIGFAGRSFCITGASHRASRKVIAKNIESLYGLVKGDVSEGLDYLVYCDGGSPCWAYSCYGRKVEAVVKNRKAGASTMIVRENDLWDALADRGCQPQV